MGKLEIYGIALLVLGLAIGGAYLKGHHSGYVEGTQEVQVKFDAFVNETKAVGLKAEQDKLDKEKQYASNIVSANAGRDSALAGLRVAQAAARTLGSRLSGAPAAPAGSSQVNFDSAAYNAAFQQYRSRLVEIMGRLGEIATDGATAQIDGQTLIRAWPAESGKPLKTP